MDTKHEWRVFVAPQPLLSTEKSGVRVTAISQYSWHRVVSAPLEHHEATMILGAANKILYDIMENPHPNQAALIKQGFVFDFVLQPPYNLDPILVELNTFGSRSGCGSGLFHWLRDHDQLYGQKAEVLLRVLVD